MWAHPNYAIRGEKWEQPEVSVRNAPVAAADSVPGSEKGR